MALTGPSALALRATFAYLTRCTPVLSTQYLTMNKRRALCNSWHVRRCSRMTRGKHAATAGMRYAVLGACSLTRSALWARAALSQSPPS
eukprot:2086360-Alexandrium_andersonii.AAC.1